MRRCSILLAVLLFSFFAFHCSGQGTAFTYQGRLDEASRPANGSYDFQFRMWNAASGGAQQGNALTNAASTVSNGIFTVTLDFSDQFPGTNRWLEIAVRTNGGGTFSTLSPRQQITATPYALHANNAGSAATVPGLQLNTNLSSTALGFNTLADGSASTAMGQGSRASGAMSTAMGNNTVAAGNAATALGRSTLAGGAASLAAGRDSVANGDYSTALGRSTTASGLDAMAMGYQTVASGAQATALGQSTTAGGIASFAAGTQSRANHDGSFVWADRNFADFTSTASNQFLVRASGGVGINTNNPGGAALAVQGNAAVNGNATVNGNLAVNGAFTMGNNNVAAGLAATALGRSTLANGAASLASGRETVAGGDNSTALGFQTTASGAQATALGQSTTAGGFNSLAAGTVARANHDGTFVWADYNYVDFASTATNQFLIRAAAGVGINTNNPNGAALAVNGNVSVNGAIGTPTSQALELKVNGQRAMRLEPTAAQNYVNVIGGSALNSVDAGAIAATISGGYGNRIQANANYASIGGGFQNMIQPSAYEGTIGGGAENTIQGEFATIPGGWLNSATNYAFAAGTRAKANHTGAFVWADSIGGDFASTANNQFLIRAAGGVGINKNNPATALDVNGTVTASGFRGTGGTTRIQGADNWDVNNTEGDFRVGNDAQRFKIGVATSGGGAGDVWMRAQGGTARVFIKTPGGTTFYSNEGQTAGVTMAPGGGSWTVLSDRNAKENFRPVNAADVLAKVAALPLSTWNYKSQDANIQHLGPMAQDFKAAFGLGESDTGITTVDADGVALAAIQGLNRKVEQQRAENAELKRELAELKKLVQQLARPIP